MNPNRFKTVFIERQKTIVKEAMDMFEVFRKAAQRNRDNGGKVAFEWPSNNTYWRRPEVLKFMKEFKIDKWLTETISLKIT